MPRRTLLGLIAAIVASAAAATGASGVPPLADAPNGDTYVHVAKVTPTTFKGRGPYDVGEVTVSVPVPSEGYSTTAEIWYPARRTRARPGTYNTGRWLPPSLLALLTAHPKLMARADYPSGGVRNAVAAPGRFPLVLFSHGWAGFRDQSTFLTSRLASWGFVVAAPDHPSRDLTEVVGTYLGVPPPTKDRYADVQDLLATVHLLGGTLPAPLGDHVDATHFVVIGHSDGGVAAEELSSLETADSATQAADPDRGFIALAGASTAGIPPALPAPYDVVPDVPSIFVTAQRDAIVPAFFMKAAYDASGAPHRLITLARSGHLVFSDTCATVPGTGVLVALFNGLKLALPAQFRTSASDGCHAPDLAVTTVWPAIDQLAVAGVRWMDGIDHTTAGLNGLRAAFPSLVTTDTTGVVR